MTRARDVASILTAASTLATDVETAAAISAHNSDTTSVHGITDTADLATSTSVSSAITTHATAANGHTTRGNTASKPVSASVGDLYSNTETGYIEVYTSSGWSQLGVIPTSPSIGTATNVGTNRAYDNGAVSVTFSPGAGGGLVSSFTSTSVSGGYSGSGTSSPVLVTGIPTGTSATFTVVATNGYGNSLASAASNSVTVTTVPQGSSIGNCNKS
jgi:trimeric autotransporter adhesin